MRATYKGDAPVTFSHYLDVSDRDAITTLKATPGETYDIEQATGLTAPTVDGQVAGLTLPMPPDKDWTETDTPTWADVAAQKAKEQEAEAPAPAAVPTPPPTPAPPARARKKEQADG